MRLRKLGKLRVLIALATLAAVPVAGAAPKSVILLIGDGMGFEHMRAASFYAHGQADRLFMQTLPHAGRMSTDPAQAGAVTDSAAAATALATGRKVNNRVVSLAVPGDGESLETLLETARDDGKLTGLVSTSYMTHATPAGFAAHVRDRGMYSQIAEQYFNESRPNVLFGGLRDPEGEKPGVTRKLAEKNGYRVVTDRKQLAKLKPAKDLRISGQFAPGGHMPYIHDEPEVYKRIPHLHEMTAKALELLGSGGKGFFLMVEGARIDHAGHRNDIANAVAETLEFDRTVRTVMDWAKDRKDVLVVVTADHECGALAVLENAGKGKLPKVRWGSKHHTGVKVPLFATGPGSKAIDGATLENTDVYRLLRGTYAPENLKPTPDVK